MAIFSRKEISSTSSSSKGPERVVITGIGTVTPQSNYTLGTALALRFRKTCWCEHETVLLPCDRDGIVLRGATVSRVPDTLIPPHLDDAERAAALFVPALRECLTALSASEISSLSCHVDNFMLNGREEFLPLLGATLADLGSPLSEGEAPSGTATCGFFDSIISAAEQLQQGDTERILVGCVDSLCATSWLMAVRDDGVLKDSLTPEGIIAGEAAGAVLLELESAARARKAEILAVLSSWGCGMETESWFGPVPATGRGLTEAFSDAFSRLDGNKMVTTVVADLNGERHRALDWAYAEARIFKNSQRALELRHPAFLTGDCGGATGAVLLADALGNFTFHPQLKGRIGLVTSDESGARRVVVIERGDHRGRKQLMTEIRRNSIQASD
jgi:3-oxoacyl-[acyl-carrier-protein] synthase I